MGTTYVHVKTELTVSSRIFHLTDPSSRTPIRVCLQWLLAASFRISTLIIKKASQYCYWRLVKTFDVYLTSSAKTLRAAKTILAAFSNALNKHMFSCVHHLSSLSFVMLYYSTIILLCQLFYLSSNSFIYHLTNSYTVFFEFVNCLFVFFSSCKPKSFSWTYD